MTQRSAFVLRVRPDKIDEYLDAHREVWPEMLAALREAGIRNYTIFLKEPENILFAYWQYHGKDFKADMERIKKAPRMQEWWNITDAMQIPYDTRKAGDWWAVLENVFHTD